MTQGVLALQVVLVASAVGTAFVLGGSTSALSALFGGIIAVVNTGLLAWRKRQISRMRGVGAAASLRKLYRSVFERFAAVAALFAFGLGLLELPPLPLFGGFMCATLATLVLLWSELGTYGSR